MRFIHRYRGLREGWTHGQQRTEWSEYERTEDRTHGQMATPTYPQAEASCDVL